MSKLPAALAARLAKRGILPKSELPPKEEVEEVIAEDYDDDEEDAKEKKVESKPIVYKSIPTFIGCPHKYNIYHTCTTYCQQKYSDYPTEPSPELVKAYKKLLKKYPLTTQDWSQIYEPGVRTFFFWNHKTDQVSWLPPSHPKAKPSLAAEKVRNLLREHEKESDDKNDDDSSKDGSSSGEDDDDSDSDGDSSSSEDDSQVRGPPIKKRYMPNTERLGNSFQNRNPRPIKKHNDLDPMDPAAYSDTPRGKWSTGLQRAKDEDL